MLEISLVSCNFAAMISKIKQLFGLDLFSPWVMIRTGLANTNTFYLQQTEKNETIDTFNKTFI